MRLFVLLVLTSTLLRAAVAQQMPAIGIAMDYRQDSLLYAAGYRHLVENVVKYFSPLTVSDAAFAKNVETFAKLRTKIYALNVFMPGEMKLVGPGVNEEAIVTYVRGVFERCQRAGVTLIVWGSGGARRIPEGYDREMARQQFIAIARKVSVIASEYKVQLALENLNSTETNFINTVAEALDIVKAVNHRSFRLCADLYHMLMENESAAVIEAAGSYIIHCDIAEREGRTAPGVHGQDFIPYLTALHKTGYNKVIIMECRWDNVAEEVKTARAELLKQIDIAYKKR